MAEELLNVLVVEDSPDDAELLIKEIEKLNGYIVNHLRVGTERDYRIALAEQSWDIIISDYNLPSFSGIQAFEILQSFGLKHMPFILLSGVITQEEIGKAKRMGIREYLSKDDISAIKVIIKRELELAADYEAQIKFFSDVLDLRDADTQGHSERVASLTVDLARLMGVKETEIPHIRRGALLHDIGKIKVPDAILVKAERLTAAEYEIMKQHPVTGYEILSRQEFLERSVDIPHYHHEKWDGTGYPRGLKGREIPLHARIFSVVDVFDALSHDRPYREAWDKARVLRHIHNQRGSDFDPRVVDVFIKMMEGRE